MPDLLHPREPITGTRKFGKKYIGVMLGIMAAGIGLWIFTWMMGPSGPLRAQVDPPYTCGNGRANYGEGCDPPGLICADGGTCDNQCHCVGGQCSVGMQSGQEVLLPHAKEIKASWANGDVAFFLYRNASTSIKLSRIQLNGLSVSVANPEATLTDNGADFDLVALGATDAFVVYEDKSTHRCKAALVHWPDHWSAPVITTPVDVPTTVNNAWCTRPLTARSLGGNRIVLSWGIEPNASLATRIAATVATANTTDDTISFGTPSEVSFRVNKQTTLSIGRDLGRQMEIVPTSPSNLIFITISTSYALSRSRVGWFAHLLAWSSPRGPAAGNGTSLQVNDCTVDGTVITCDPEQQREVVMAGGDVSATVDGGKLLIAPVAIGNGVGVGVREGETSGLKGTPLPGWSNEDPDGGVLQDYPRFFSILPLSNGKFIVAAKRQAGTSAALGEIGGNDIIWAHLSSYGGKVIIPAGGQDRFLFFNYPDSLQTGGSTAVMAAQFAESCPQCGNGTAETGEQCGEPGLTCLTGSSCQECRCIAASSSSVVSSHLSVSSVLSSSSLSPASSVSSLGLLSSSSAGSSVSSVLPLSSSSSSVIVAASSSAAYPVTSDCGNGMLQGVEQCEAGIPCAAGSICSECFCIPQSVSSFSSAQLSSFASSQGGGGVCGNDILDELEQCDRNADYCPEGFTCDYTSCFCMPEDVFPSASSASSTEVSSEFICGNGVREGTEQCDTGIPCSGNGFCTADCMCQILEMPSPDEPSALSRCGDGILGAGEQCDSGIPCANNGFCTAACICQELKGTAALCGNGVLNAREECDDANTKNGDGCSAHCNREVTEPTVQCGNNRIEGDEQCERTIPCPGTNYLCRNCQCFATAVPVCGNGTLESDEACETTVPCTDPTFLCASCRCIPPVCGDGSRTPGEECDDGNTRSGDGCSASCTREIPTVVASEQLCGNGIVELSEECDDGNQTNFDGCSASCSREAPALESLDLSLVTEDHPVTVTVTAPSAPVLLPTSVTGPTPKKSLPSDTPVPIPPPRPATSSAPVSVTFPVAATVTQQLPVLHPTYGQPSAAVPAFAEASVGQPYASVSGPAGKTGPASLALMVSGAAAGFAWMRRKRGR